MVFKDNQLILQGMGLESPPLKVASQFELLLT